MYSLMLNLGINLEKFRDNFNTLLDLLIWQMECKIADIYTQLSFIYLILYIKFEIIKILYPSKYLVIKFIAFNIFLKKIHVNAFW